MLKIAFFSPLPPDRSGVSAYSLELLPYLSESIDITLFHNDPAHVLPQPFPIFSISTYPQKHWDYHLPVYHLGNNHLHLDIYTMFRRHPGIVVLHDFVLHDLMRLADYRRELAYRLGSVRATEAWSGRSPVEREQYPLNERVLDLALGVIVHSQYAATRIAQSHPHLPVATVPMPMLPVTLPARDISKPLTFGCIGEVTPPKQVDLALRAFSKFHSESPDSRFHIVGDIVEVDLTKIIDSLPPTVQSNIYSHGYANTHAEFENQINAIDIVINLRYPTMGETSAAALRALAHSKPIIVFDHGTYRELPDTIAVKVPPLDELALLEAMQYTASNLARLVSNTHPFVRAKHDPRNSADQYMQLCHQIYYS